MVYKDLQRFPPYAVSLIALDPGLIPLDSQPSVGSSADMTRKTNSNSIISNPMIEQYLPLIIQLLSGAVGGNIVGAIAKKLSMGPLLNSILGILGGGIGSQILAMLNLSATSGGTFDLNTILTQIGAGGAGGGLLMAIIGLIRSFFKK